MKYRKVCALCRKPVEGDLERCPECGSPLVAEYSIDKGSLKSILEKANYRRDQGIWGFKELLPVERPGVTLGEAWTPLIRAERLREKLGLKLLYLKNEAQNPTGSFIDRGSAVELEIVRESGYREIVGFGSGDLVASLVAYSTANGIKPRMLVEKGSEISRLYSTVLSGGDILLVDDRFEGLERARRISKVRGSFLVLPYSLGLIEGYRTILFEICLSRIKPDRIIVPVGDGILAISIYKALEEVKDVFNCDLGIVGVRVRWGVKPKILELSIEKPFALEHLKALINRHGDLLVTLDPTEVYKAVYELASTQGIVADPAGAAGLAALRNLLDDGRLDKSEKVVILITGSGSKNPMLMLESLKVVGVKWRNISISSEHLSEPKVEILRIIANSGSDYAYSIWKKLRDLGLNLDISTVHQHIKSLERKGFVKVSERAGRRIFYTLTSKGYEVLSRSQ